MPQKKNHTLPKETHTKAFPIVSIGASAGGLAAFEAFFSRMPQYPVPCAFVLIQHLSPDFKSSLVEIIGNYTPMSVFEITDGMVVEPNCVYIIPPAHDISLVKGAFELLNRTKKKGLHLPINFFFNALAKDQHQNAIGIILSGTGSDGTKGILSIKENGGMVMAQSIASAQYDGMPSSAIGTGLVDHSLPPEEMGVALMNYITSTWDTLLTEPPLDFALKHENVLKKIFILLREQTGHDFSQYKPNTIHRRIARRMDVVGIESLEKYATYLKTTPDEIEALFRDVLIGVTHFFRDKSAFEALEKIIPELLRSKSMSNPFRAWSCGCSSGEEAYSLAILLAEYKEASKLSFSIQIFATDIDERAIANARSGLYTSDIVEDVSPKRLASYFTLGSDAKTYRINKNIRDMVIFSEQNITRDPPFSKLDLICCRNLLIYMNPSLQKKIIPLFQYALNPNGVLFLGNSEGVGEFEHLFSVMDQKAKLYRCVVNPDDSRRKLMEHVLPLPTLESRRFSSANIPLVREPNKQPLANVFVNAGGDKLYLYSEAGLQAKSSPLKNEETAIEELQSLNEELQSINEELQSTNEELETSKEEMQSLNEELSTVNSELQTKIIALSQANNDMNNLLSGTGVATLFLDKKLNVMRFTPSCSLIINLITGDIGRPIGHIVPNLVNYTTLQADAQGVLDTLIPTEIRVCSTTDKWYMMHIIPYRTLENVVEGVVVSFVDITEIKALRRLAVIVNDANDAIIMHDLEGNILAWNKSATQMYGWSETEALKLTMNDHVPQSTRKEALKKIIQLSRHEVLAPYLTQRLAKNGSIKDVWITATALIDETGKMYAVATTERLVDPTLGVPNERNK
ncbi:MAG: chemotaxis protein methyltransferase [Proteobacteria bacterium]|nr:chemotaxis protein methyltransferase [Pseudomonadota bacterium]